MEYLAFRCPLCAEAFQVAAAHVGREVACPHCGQAVSIPAAQVATAAELPRPSSSSRLTQSSSSAAVTEAEVSPNLPHRLADREPPTVARRTSSREPPDESGPARVQDRKNEGSGQAGQVPEVRSLTPEERAAFRRRVNLVVIALTAVVLASVAIGLLLWSGGL